MSCPNAAEFFSGPAPLKRLSDFYNHEIVRQHIHGETECLIISGPKYKQHIDDCFDVFKARHVTIIERDLETVDRLFQSSKVCWHAKNNRVTIREIKAEKTGYYGYEVVDLDLMQTCVKTGPTLKRALKEQMDSVGSRNKMFIFSMSLRRVGYEKSFLFLNELLSPLGCSLEGFNGAIGTFGEASNMIPKKKGVGTGNWTLYKEFIPTFIEKGRVKSLKASAYKDENHMLLMTIAIAYR